MGYAVQCIPGYIWRLSPEELEIVAKAVEVILREAQLRDTGTMVKWTEVPRSNRHNPSTGGS